MSAEPLWTIAEVAEALGLAGTFRKPRSISSRRTAAS